MAGASSSSSPTSPQRAAQQGRCADLADRLEAVRRIDAIFDIEREINGPLTEDRLAVRRLRSAPLN
jgi:hypothetical protein